MEEEEEERMERNFFFSFFILIQVNRIWKNVREITYNDDTTFMNSCRHVYRMNSRERERPREGLTCYIYR